MAWIEINDKKIWDQSLAASSQATFLQAWSFGEFQQNLGNKIWRLGLKQEDALKGFCQIVKLESRLGSFFYVPGGPIIENFDQNLGDLVKAITDLAVSEKVDFLRFDPRIINEKNQEILFNLGFKVAPVFTQPQCSLALDLNESLEVIKKNFSESTRYNVGWVDRQGVKVEISQDTSDIVLFTKLLQETAFRHKFKLYKNQNYYKEQFKAFAKNSQAKLFLAYSPEEFGREVLASAIVIYFGKTATYLHAASSAWLPKLRAPYLMQWEIIQDAKESGFTNYDFWGIAKDQNPRDPWAGVTAFKQSFGGSKLCYQKPYDKLFSNKYYLNVALEKTRGVLKRLKF